MLNSFVNIKVPQEANYPSKVFKLGPSQAEWTLCLEKDHLICGQSYKASMIVIYASRVVPDLKIPHITMLES